MKELLYIVLMLLPVFSGAQQVTQYSNVNILPSLYNPSVIGTEEEISAHLLRRAQWVGFNGSPVANALLVDKKISDTHGAGLNVYHETKGAFSSVVAKLVYGYHLALGNDSRLGAGVTLGYGMSSSKVRTNAIIEDVNDPMLNGGDVSAGMLDASFGLHYQWKKLQLGLAIPQVVAPKSAALSYQQERAYIAHVGYRHFITDNVELLPFAIMRVAPNAPLQYDVKARLIFSEFWWAGTGYRSDYAANLEFGANIKSYYIGYSYDIPLNSYVNFGQSHEIIIGYRKKPKKKIDYSDIE